MGFDITSSGLERAHATSETGGPPVTMAVSEVSMRSWPSSCGTTARSWGLTRRTAAAEKARRTDGTLLASRIAGAAMLVAAVAERSGGLLRVKVSETEGFDSPSGSHVVYGRPWTLSCATDTYQFVK
jgi:hypothetical protein